VTDPVAVECEAIVEIDGAASGLAFVVSGLIIDVPNTPK
jgi:hypothetical protein